MGVTLFRDKDDDALKIAYFEKGNYSIVGEYKNGVQEVLIINPDNESKT